MLYTGQATLHTVTSEDALAHTEDDCLYDKSLSMLCSKSHQAKLFKVKFGGIYHWNRFPQNPPIALQDGVGLVGIHALYSYFGVYLKSFKADNATAFDQFESNWSENLSACRATAAQGGHQTCAKIKSVPLEPLI